MKKIMYVLVPALILGALACGSAVKDATSHTILLEVTGPVTADITYSAVGQQAQELGAALPWVKTVTIRSELPIATVLAQSKGVGEIRCKITKDGKVTRENVSNGQYSVVTCSS